MEIYEKLKNLIKEKKTAAVFVLGIAGLVLIMLSSIFSGKNTADYEPPAVSEEVTAESYCKETEKRLEDFLKNIEGAGDVRVYLSVGTGEKYVYAAEKNTKSSENQREEDTKYVIVGGGSEKSALVETVRTPEITGAVIACTGCGSPAVQERIYKAASAALGLPTSKIFVTQMK